MAEALGLTVPQKVHTIIEMSGRAVRVSDLLRNCMYDATTPAEAELSGFDYVGADLYASPFPGRSG